MKLTVGITQLLPEWKILINQIGVSYEDLHPIKPIKPDQASVIIVTEQGLQTEKDILLQYLNFGGSILIEANIAEWLFDIKTVQSFINNIEPIKDSIFGNISPVKRGATISPWSWKKGINLNFYFIVKLDKNNHPLKNLPIFILRL